ncbi:MAG: hypothetical protein GC164_16215 [Phycisphaera sp.]|nr:hypothetical protein [Phycisphaera sp.]
MPPTPPPTPIRVNKKLLLANSIGTAVAHVLNIVALIWVVQHLLSRIPADEYELLPIISSLVIFLPIAIDTFTSGIARFVTEAYVRKDFDRIVQITSTMFIVNIVVMVVLLAILSTLTWKLNYVLDIAPGRLGEARLMFSLLLMSSVLYLPSTPFAVGMHVRQRFLVLSGIALLGTLIRIILLFSLILGIGPDVLYVAIANCAANVFMQVGRVVCSMRMVPELRVKLGSFRMSVAKQILGFGAWSTVGRTAGAIRDGSDPILLNHLTDAIQVNSFHVGSLIERQFKAILSKVATPFEPVFTSLHVDDNDHRFGNAYLRVTRLILWVTTPPIIPLLVYRNELMGLYLKDALHKYPTVPDLLGVLTLGMPIMATNIPIWFVARARARIAAYSTNGLIVEVSNLALTLLLVYTLQIGAMGSALGTFISNVILCPILIWPLGCRLASVRVRDHASEMLLGLAPTTIIAALGEYSRLIWAPHSWLTLGASSVLLYALSIAVVVALMKPADRNDFKKTMNKLVGRFRG